jgi:hypothetical protein
MPLHSRHNRYRGVNAHLHSRLQYMPSIPGALGVLPVKIPPSDY